MLINFYSVSPIPFNPVRYKGKRVNIIERWWQEEKEQTGTSSPLPSCPHLLRWWIEYCPVCWWQGRDNEGTGGVLFSRCFPIILHLLNCVRLFATPWTAACQASLSFGIYSSLLKLMSIELVMLSNRLTLCHPRLLLPSIFPSIIYMLHNLSLDICPHLWNHQHNQQNRFITSKYFLVSLFFTFVVITLNRRSTLLTNF